MADPFERPPPYQLQWGIHRRFLDYVQALPDGRCTLADGADLTEKSEFAFALGQFSGIPYVANNVEIRFFGSVRFLGHAGMLYIDIDQPWLTLGEGRAQLSITDFRLDERPRSRITLATAEVTSDEHRPGVWRGNNVALTSEGAQLFLGNYKEGEPMADFQFAVPPLPPALR
ncbi:HtaA domain-containing protein [Rhodococcoides fascians]|uniref:HtaA domain-containing protein n=1 Tax=Rhodococcoides fascians TaxID=1828 RepID=UPI00068968AC|nr:HtaA domain-containing protein [Rhodococcus fascians]